MTICAGVSVVCSRWAVCERSATETCQIGVLNRRIELTGEAEKPWHYTIFGDKPEE